MGRRKIEIQPIVHERNRSVTFLKRKNGLFKKAYELGVLCSVEVAVIIFEEKPGHHVKLYQYCSGDIRDVVARQLKHDGEIDTKGPNDFSGGGGAGKGGDDMGDGDDDEGEDDDDVAPRGPSKRSRNENSRSGLKLDNDMSENYLPRGNVSNMQHPLTLQSSTSSSSGLPTSTLRTSSGSSIGPASSASSTYGGHPSSNPLASSRSGSGSSRHNPHSHRANPSRSPPETHTPVSGGTGYAYSHGHAPPSSYRPAPYGNSSNGPGASAGGSGGGGSQGGGFGFYPNQTPPAGYVGLPGDYPRGGGPPGGSGGRGGGRPFGASFDGGGGAGPIYGGGPGGMHPRQRSGDAGDGGVFDFLDGNSRQPSNPNGPGFGLDWPVGSGPGGGGSAPPPPPPPASSANPNSGGGDHWFDLLGSTPNPNVQGRDTKLSWERGGGGGGGIGGGSNDRHSIPSSSSRSPSVMSVGGHSAHGQMSRGSMDMSIGMGARTGSMDISMGMGMAGVSRDGVGKLERRE